MDVEIAGAGAGGEIVKFVVDEVAVSERDKKSQYKASVFNPKTSSRHDRIVTKKPTITKHRENSSKATGF